MKYLGCTVALALATLIWGCGQETARSVSSSPAPSPAPSRASGNGEIANVDPEGEPSLARNFYFVIDDSGSMKGPVGTAGTRMEIAKRATIEFLKHVPADVQMGLYALNRGELVALGKDNRDRFIAAVQELGPAGGTPLNAAIDKGVDVLVEQRKRQLGYGDFRVIVVTDGESGDGDIATNAGPYARGAKIPLYTIGFCVEGDHALKRFSLSYRAADSEKDLQEGLEETAGESESFDAAAFGK